MSEKMKTEYRWISYQERNPNTVMRRLVFTSWLHQGPLTSCPGGCQRPREVRTVPLLLILLQYASLLHFIYADILNKVDKEGRTILHCAVENERIAVVQLLSSMNSRTGREKNMAVDASLRDKGKRAPLHLAVNGGNKHLVQVYVHMFDRRC